MGYNDVGKSIVATRACSAYAAERRVSNEALNAVRCTLSRVTLRTKKEAYHWQPTASAHAVNAQCTLLQEVHACRCKHTSNSSAITSVRHLLQSYATAGGTQWSNVATRSKIGHLSISHHHIITQYHNQAALCLVHHAPKRIDDD